MFFLLIIHVSFVCGEVTQHQFLRQKSISDVTNTNVSRVGCAITCLYDEKCLSYYVYTKARICEPSTAVCNQPKEGIVCYNRKSRSRRERSNEEDVQRDYLLFIPNQLLGHTVRKFDFETGAVIEYIGLHYENALSGAVMPLSRKILLCIGIPYKIITFSLLSQKKMILRKGHAIAMAVDETQQIIFVSLAQNSRGEGKILGMTPEGRVVKVVRRRRELSLNLMTDVKHHKLYVAYDGSIDAVDYVTWAEDTIITDKSLSAFTLDPVKGVLFYSQAYFLMGISLRDRKTRKIINLWNKPTALEYYNNDIYAVSSGRVNFEKIKNVYSRRPSIKFLPIKEAGSRPLMLKITA